MARGTSLETQQKRLRLKSEELQLRVKLQDQKERLVQVKQQLKNTGGRIR